MSHDDDRTRYIEITVQSALTRVDSARMPGLKWSLNPYRGCKHNCVYCYARYTHEFLELDPTKDFAQTVYVKRNLPQALRADLRKSSWQREHVSIGTATDPYQPAEGRYQLTRNALLVLREQLTPAGLVTKNTMALRDADIMASLSRAAGFHLIMSISTIDPVLARQLEPDAPTPQQRLRTVQQLVEAGVRVSVALAPVLPGITDGESQLAELIEAAYDHGAEVAFHQPFRMYSATRASLFAYLKTHHPHLLEPYQRVYSVRQDPPREYRWKLSDRIERVRRRLAPRQPASQPMTPNEGQLQLGL
ncbi:MAG: radical SAM protein [Caldilineales bacterium]|nr:radical SAM protein [Caldilineales bacterium]